MKAFFSFVIHILTWTAAPAADFPVADYGARGDGKTDDGPSIRKAVAAAVASGAGSRVVFEAKTYRLDWCKTAESQVSIVGATNLALEGNGAMLLNHPRNNLISLRNCAGVTVRGFTLDYDPLPFTQGTITEVNAKAGWMEFRVKPGYSHPVEVYESLKIKPPKKDWGVAFDPVARHRRWDVAMQFYMEEFMRSPAGEDIVRVAFVEGQTKELAKIRPGDRFVVTYKFGVSGENIGLSKCGNCRFEDFTVHMAKYGMTFGVSNSTAQNVFRRVKMAFPPGSDRLIVTPKDGFHCKGNRVGPLIEECFFEGLLDDSINISVCPYWIRKVIAPGIYAMSGAPVVGDRLTAHTPSRSEMVEDFVVKSVKPYSKKPKWTEVTLNREISNPGVNTTGNDFPGGLEKLKFTGMYNVSASGANYVVRSCTFREQRRHGILARAPDGIIEGNIIDGVGGCGVYLANECGSFYEGPLPHHCIIRGNVFRNTQGRPIFVGAKRVSNPAAYTKNIRITGNTIESHSAPCIEASSVSRLKIADNKMSLKSPASNGINLLSIKNSVDEASSTSKAHN